MIKEIVGVVVIVVGLSACGESAKDKINRQIKERVHSLTADERPLAQANAKAFFEKEFPVQRVDGTLTKERGQFLECRPSDSNFNGLVTCKGLIPLISGGFKEATRYCGYRPELVGCSDEDTTGK